MPRPLLDQPGNGESDYTPEQRAVMMGPGFTAGMAESFITAIIIVIIAVGLLGFGIGWLVFG